MAASMALQVVVSPFLGVLFDNLTSLIRKEVGLLWGVDKEMKKLASTLSTIQAVLEDAEEKQLTNKAIVNWLRKLKEAAYDADDVLDEWATEAMQLDLGSEHMNTRSKRVCDSFLSCISFEQIKFRRKIAEKINELRETFNEIAAERSNFHLTVGAVERKIELYPNRETSSSVTEPRIYGRDEDKEYIVRLLLDNVNSQDDLSVCPILGIGGLGKTTIAQSVYNDQKIKEHFEVKIWVCVSVDFDIKRLTRAVIASISEVSCTLEELDPLQRCLQEKLAGKRFLLVLDDVWNENQEEWNRFKYSLKCGAKGSSVIVTTRPKTVASITGTCPAYLLKPLSDDDCWSLFRHRAFGMGNEESPNMVKIGKEIVKKCGGLPLAAKVLGGLMRFKVEENEWLFVRDSNIWDLPKSDENTILPALRLSYSHLSPQLRQCFVYCSIFPKDHEMKKEELIYLWMANGLFQSKEGTRLDDIGNDIFNALLWKSFFEEVKSHGDTSSYMVHDLIHDLACSISMNECCNVDWCSQITDVPEGVRHLSVSYDMTSSSSAFQSMHQSAPKVRTLVLGNFGDYATGRKLPTHFILSTFTLLRALSLPSVEDTSLPESIGNLMHLRYVNLSYSQITSLPESICRLRNLQTLKLKCCYNLQKLPKYMRTMGSLRHLDMRQCYRLREMPIRMGQLTCLHTLSIFIVGSDNGRHIKELQRMEHLGGELTVEGLEHVKSSRDAKDANLIRKRYLSSLGLTWSGSHVEDENDREVIEGLQPHPNMKKLCIERYQGLTFPSWLEVSSLPNLVEIVFLGCTRCEHLPSLGRLPLLKILHISQMHYVKFFSSSNDDDMVNGFPSLEELSLHSMPELEEWCSLIVGNNNGGGVEQEIRLPCLKKLRISDCPKLKRLPLLLSLESLDVQNCNEMVLGSVKNLHRLSKLDIKDFSDLTCFPEGMLQNLTALQSLSIQNSRKVETLPTELENLSSLKCFIICRLGELKSLPEVGRSSLTNLIICDWSSLANLSEVLRGCQTTLINLQITRCPKLDLSTMEFQQLNVLQNLRIVGFPDLTCLPDRIQHVSSTLQELSIGECCALISLPDWIGSLTNLRYLWISDCENLAILPDGLQHLTNLRYLWISDCENLRMLPEGLQHLTNLQYLGISDCENLRMLPEGLQHLTNLETLSIRNCHPELERRCDKERGEYWHNISHIPRLSITSSISKHRCDSSSFSYSLI